MHKPETVIENQTHKILLDFEIQMDHLIPARKPDLFLINWKKITCHQVYFAVPMNHRMKERKQKMDKLLDFARELRTKWQR